MKKLLGLAAIGAAVAFVATRKKAATRRHAEEQRYRRDLERFEGEGGVQPTL